MRLAILIFALTATSAAAQGDRYGPSPSQGPAAPAAGAWKGPMLGWSRKTSPSAYRPIGPQRLPNGLYAGAAEPTVQIARAAPPPLPKAVAPQGPAALPDSLYAQPAPAAAGANPYASSSPRFYSVYREYGGQPDPIALPPPGMTWASRPEASLIEPLDPPKKKKKDDARSAAEEDGDWGASDLMDEPS